MSVGALYRSATGRTLSSALDPIATATPTYRHVIADSDAGGHAAATEAALGGPLTRIATPADAMRSVGALIPPPTRGSFRVAPAAGLRPLATLRDSTMTSSLHSGASGSHGYENAGHGADTRRAGAGPAVPSEVGSAGSFRPAGPALTDPDGISAAVATMRKFRRLLGDEEDKPTRRGAGRAHGGSVREQPGAAPEESLADEHMAVTALAASAASPPGASRAARARRSPAGTAQPDWAQCCCRGASIAAWLRVSSARDEQLRILPRALQAAAPSCRTRPPR